MEKGEWARCRGGCGPTKNAPCVGAHSGHGNRAHSTGTPEPAPALRCAGGRSWSGCMRAMHRVAGRGSAAPHSTSPQQHSTLRRAHAGLLLACTFPRSPGRTPPRQLHSLEPRGDEDQRPVIPGQHRLGRAGGGWGAPGCQEQQRRRGEAHRQELQQAAPLGARRRGPVSMRKRAGRVHKGTRPATQEGRAVHARAHCLPPSLPVVLEKQCARLGETGVLFLTHTIPFIKRVPPLS